MAKTRPRINDNRKTTLSYKLIHWDWQSQVDADELSAVANMGYTNFQFVEFDDENVLVATKREISPTQAFNIVIDDWNKTN